ncbi:Arylsulfatase A [Cyclobacterium xiamenense]|uniref:Arylsulfatase A n=1 Tax=Cyclobacterium xiamenense TaxID=1297121 RepID=A0A1H6TU88_9BACT|nr:sulfatase [Cyclobacterium xiamenense]SEI81754.1 Arylsulfatase A [Cyclobacterium xiamenense]
MKKIPVASYLLAILVLVSGIRVFAQDTRPNIVMIIADDIGYEDTSPYGQAQVKTPTLERLAADGLRFTNFYLTASSCSPSRCSLISGRYPHNTGAAELHTPLPESIAIFPEFLKKAGYFTGQAGKWHMGPAARRGFDRIYDKGPEIGDGGEDMWVPLLQERPRDKPFFLWLASLDAHRPWGSNSFSGTHRPEAVQVPPYLAEAAATKTDLARYYDEISRFDAFIGEVEAELKRQGVLENTLIVVLSDNGRPFPRSKTRLIDSGIKSPLIIKWPKGIGKGGMVSESLLSSIDLAPTFLELAGVPIPDAFQGKSFGAVLENPGLPFRQFVFAEHNWHDHEAHARMVRTKDYLYIKNNRPGFSNPGPADSNSSDSFADLKRLREAGSLNPAQADVFMAPRPAEELYRVNEDTYQLLNRAIPGEEGGMLDYMRGMLEQWSTETDDSVPDRLTADWYDKETGKSLDKERIRGQMPGGPDALTTTNKGPF